MSAVVLDASRKVDPTGTGRIRQRFVNEMDRRFQAIKRLVRKAIAEEDVLGLSRVVDAVVGDAVPPRRAFAFIRSADKIAAFMEWLRIEEELGILGVTPGTPLRNAAAASWANKYIDSAYRRGIRDATRNMESAGAKIEESWIDAAFNRPIHADRVGLLYTRTFSDLKGITDVMDQRISRTLAEGMAEGLGPYEIAREIAQEIDGISRTRAKLLARTEIIAAHAEASLNSYAEAGVEGVEADVEFSTAKDDRVCPDCEELEGEVMEIDEARGIIPVHPNCRCAWKPKVISPTGITLR